MGTDAWRRGMAGWHAVFGVLAVLTGVLVAGDDGLGAGTRLGALGLLAGLGLWYVATGSRALRHESVHMGLVYLAAAAPLTVGLFAVAPAGALMLVVLYPHLWALLSRNHAVMGSVVVVFAVSGVILAQSGMSAGLVPAIVYAVVGLLVALLLGLWITRIIEQSKERAELIAELKATRDELAKVSREAGTLAERARVARDIHDTLAQGFTSVLLQLEAVEAELGSPDAARHHVAAAKRTTRANLAEARSLIAALTPPDLRASSLPGALKRLADRQEFAVAFHVTGEPRALPASGEVVLFRAVQEALANVAKHAGASRVDVELGYADGLVCLRIRDDGVGFDPGAPTSGFGLAGMRARVADVAGDLRVESAPGNGTTVHIVLRAQHIVYDAPDTI